MAKTALLNIIFSPFYDFLRLPSSKLSHLKIWSSYGSDVLFLNTIVLIISILLQRVEEFIKNSENAVSDMEKLRQHLTNNQDLLKHSTAEIVLTVSGEKFNIVIDHVKKVSQSGQMMCQRIEKMYVDLGQPFPQDVLDTKEAVDRYMRIVHDKMMVVVDCWNGVQKKVDGIKVETIGCNKYKF